MEYNLEFFLDHFADYDQAIADILVRCDFDIRKTSLLSACRLNLSYVSVTLIAKCLHCDDVMEYLKNIGASGND